MVKRTGSGKKNKSFAAMKSGTPDKVATDYDTWSRTYEQVENRTRNLAASALRQQQILNLIDKDALEIGCGTGFNTRYLAAHCRSVFAVDFSEGMLSRARANVSAANVSFARGDIRQKWNFPDASFDLIVCTLVLEHVENLRHVFAEAARVLRTGGEFLIYELHPFRQMRGGQAQFTNADSNKTVFIPAFTHDISEFVNAGVESRFELLKLEEVRDEDENKSALPRLLSLLVRTKGKHF